MPSILSRAKTVLLDMPGRGKLAYCLLRDERVPSAPKAVLLAALGVIVSPLDFPAWIPVLGELDVLALGLLAVETGKGAEAEARRLREAAQKRETKDRTDAQAVADEIDNKTVVVRLKVGAEDKAFGSITNQDVAAALKAQHRVEIDRHKIDLREPIKTLGEHQVALKLHRDVSAHVNVIVTQDR